MGYNKRPGVVEKYQQTLEEIKQALDSGNSVKYEVMHPAHLARMRDRLHWFLGCAKVFLNECNGRYADLRDRAKVSVVWEERCVIVTSSNVSPIAAPVAAQPSERDALRQLKHSKEDMKALDFTPSPSYPGDEWFRQEINKLGWTLNIEENDPYFVSQGAPPKVYIAMRDQPKGSAFDFLDSTDPPNS